MPRRYGYAPKGQRCWGVWNWHERGRKNVIGALLGASLLTACIFETTIKSNIFEAWLSEDLIPKLPPGSVVVMDNAPFHKAQPIQELLEKHGHQLLLQPKYSPDLNPIEHKWAQLKALRRKNDWGVEECLII